MFIIIFVHCWGCFMMCLHCRNQLKDKHSVSLFSFFLFYWLKYILWASNLTDIHNMNIITLCDSDDSGMYFSNWSIHRQPNWNIPYHGIGAAPRTNYEKSMIRAASPNLSSHSHIMIMTMFMRMNDDSHPSKHIHSGVNHIMGEVRQGTEPSGWWPFVDEIQLER